jgi:subtilisin family serine protease
MRSFRFLAAVFAVFLLSIFALAHVQRPGQYMEIPGMQEFSGEMIVRPLQPEALSQMGKGQLEQWWMRRRAAQLVAKLTEEYVPATDEYIVRLPFGKTENQFSVELMKTGLYQYAEPNWICYPVAIPNDTLFGSQWHHVKVKSIEAWDYFTGSNTVISAVVDTGIDLTHPDLAPNRVPGYNSADKLTEANGGDVSDINGHGTHVAGCAAAIGNNARGVCGMGWNFKIMMVRTSNSPGGGAPISDITDGARWAAENGAKAVSASYSGVDAAAVGTTGTYIKGIGSLFLYAAGNDNRNLTGFYWPDTIVVGASTSTDGKASFSAYGRGVHVFAPGVNILSTTRGGGYGNSSGTSMAAPVANGAVAMIFAANPSLTAQEVQDVLEDNCDNIGSSAIFSKGRINQLKNMLAVAVSPPIEVAPIGISTYVGTWASGTLADILAPNTGGPSYNVFSQDTRAGQLAGVEVEFDSNVTSGAVRHLTLTYQAKAEPNNLVTAFVYAWNYQTAQYETIGQFAIGGSTWKQADFKVTVNPERYLGPGGEVKSVLRAVATRRAGWIVPIPYVLKIGYAHLAVSVGN